MRNRVIGAFYAVLSVVPLGAGLWLIVYTALGIEESAYLDWDSFWYTLGGWSIVGGGLIAVGAYRGLRGRSPARGFVWAGLLVLGVPLLAFFGFGLVFLIFGIPLLFWRPGPAAEEHPLDVARHPT